MVSVEPEYEGIEGEEDEKRIPVDDPAFLRLDQSKMPLQVRGVVKTTQGRMVTS